MRWTKSMRHRDFKEPPEDILQDVIIWAIENNTYGKEVLKKKICNACRKTQNKQAFIVDKQEHFRVCKTCNELLPIAAFIFNKQLSGGSITSDCRQCYNKKYSNDECREKCRVRYYTKQGRVAPPRKTPAYKTKTDQFRDWLKKGDNREKWNAYMRERNKKKRLLKNNN